MREGIEGMKTMTTITLDIEVLIWIKKEAKRRGESVSKFINNVMRELMELESKEEVVEKREIEMIKWNE
ncbi:MAG: hypothetical protein ACPL1F_02335 [bacterium]